MKRLILAMLAMGSGSWFACEQRQPTHFGSDRFSVMAKGEEENPPAAAVEAGLVGGLQGEDKLYGLKGERDKNERLLKMLSAADTVMAAVGGLNGDPAAEKPSAPTLHRRKGDGSLPASPSRSWFPETFLFAPRIITDANGVATHSTRIPDRLTEWRVLALAHTRDGRQTGSELRLTSSLPLYVEPVVPAFVVVGDDLQLPVQIVNTTDKQVSMPFSLTATGATVARVPGTVTVPANGSTVVYVGLSARKMGQASVRVALGSADGVERSFPVLASDEPVVETRGGTLASPRTLSIALPDRRLAGSSSVRATVFAGAPAILGAELKGAGVRSELHADAYALLLTGRARNLWQKFGSDPQVLDEEDLRRLAVKASQGVIRAARVPDVMTAALLAETALTHPENPVLARLGERLLETVARAQSPDGTFAGETGWTLQRLLVATADCVRAIQAAPSSPASRQRSALVSARAALAIERNLARINDGYTAAAILAAGLAKGPARDRLRKLLRDALVRGDDGVSSLTTKSSVQRPDGLAPTIVESTALAMLALEGDTDAVLVVPELGAYLLSAYDPMRGFGDGRTNVVALGAILSLFSEKLPDKVVLRLLEDGQPLAEQTLDRARLRSVVYLSAATSDRPGLHRYEIRAEPPVPGLGFRLALETFVPWQASVVSKGLELSVETTGKMRVGTPVNISIRGAAPAGMPVTIEHNLPAGVTPDFDSLMALRSEGTIDRFEVNDGRVTLHTPALEAGRTIALQYRVIPTLAGSLGVGPSSIQVSDARHHVAAKRWLVVR